MIHKFNRCMWTFKRVVPNLYKVNTNDKSLINPSGSNVLQLLHRLHNSCNLSELPVKVLQEKQRNPTMKAVITQKYRVCSNKCRPGTVEWSSQKTFDKSVQRFRQTSAAGSRTGSWEIDRCQSLMLFQVSTGYPRSTEKNHKPCRYFLPLDDQEMFKAFQKKEEKKKENRL